MNEIDRAKWLLSGDRDVVPLRASLGDLITLCEEQTAEIERLENAIHQWMQTTDQRGKRETLIANFVGMYTY